MGKSKATLAREAEEREDAIKYLQEWLANVEEITTVITHVSDSGLFRTIMPLIGNPDGRVSDLSWLVARAGIAKFSRRHGGVEMGGGGMNMGFALVYNIGRAVIGDEPWMCRGEQCPSNEHVNPPRVDRDVRIMHTGDGGYRFRHHEL